MGRKIICESCGTIFNEDVIGNKEICPVCGKSLVSDEENMITWYYYGFKDEKGNKTEGGCLEEKPIDLNKFGDKFYLIKEFQAPPKDANGDCEAAKVELRKYVPDAFSPAPTTPQVRCPRCGSTEIQLVPKRFSILTGFATNQYDRMCVYCKKKF